MSVVKPQGGKGANENGKHEEDRIANFLTQHGYQYVGNPDHLAIVKALNAGADVRHLVKPGFFYRQLPAFRSIYATPFKADFVVAPFSNTAPVVLEIKSQTSSGSVDEKLAFWMLTLQSVCTRGFDCALIVLGEGARDGALEWCRENKGPVRFFTDAKTLKTYIATIQ